MIGGYTSSSMTSDRSNGSIPKREKTSLLHGTHSPPKETFELRAAFAIAGQGTGQEKGDPLDTGRDGRGAE